MENPNKKWTVDEFQTWLKENAAELEAAKEKNQLDVDSIVIREARGFLKGGMTLEDVGDMILRNPHICRSRGGVFVTKDAVICSLRKMGWKPKAERKKGG